MTDKQIIQHFKNNYIAINELKECQQCTLKTNCNECKNKKKIIKLNLLAFEHNCICTNKEYTLFTSRYNFVCLQNNHEFTTTITLIKTGCKECAREKRLLNRMIEMKNTYNYRYFRGNDLKIPQLFMCKKKHFWYVDISKAFKKCPTCMSSKKMSFEMISDIAKERGGKCLAYNSKDGKIRVDLECYIGHTWSADARNIRYNKRWCPECNINIGEEITRNIFNILFKDTFIKIRPTYLKGYEYDGYSDKFKIAFEYDGIQHYKFIKHFHKTKTEFKRKCEIDVVKNKLSIKNKIILFRIPYFIKFEKLKEYILTLCKEKNIIVPNNIDINYKTFTDVYTPKYKKFDIINEIVKNKNGTLLTDVYINSTDKFNVKCSKGHIFETYADNLKNGKRWCPVCSKKKKHTIEEMHELAHKNQGICLSTEYINNSTELEWMCSNKHKFYTVPKCVLNGHWCKICNHVNYNKSAQIICKCGGTYIESTKKAHQKSKRHQKYLDN